jgi:4-amino-4-deoxy-L-arabinose transferase-like glycosyltransferase
MELQSNARAALARHWPALLLIAAVLPRLLWIDSFNWLPISDSAWYQARAVALAQGLGYAVDGVPTAFFPIGYPAFLAALFRIFPNGPTTVALANLVLGIGLVWASLRLYRELGVGEFRSRVAALLVALCPTLILYTTLEMSETLFTLLLVCATELLLVSRRRPVAALGAGLLFGAATLVRSQTLLLPAAMLCVLLIPVRRPRWALRTGALVYVAIACVVLPWTVRNWQMLGVPALVSTNDGYNLLLGNNPWQVWGAGYPVPPALAADLVRTDEERRSGAGEAAWDGRMRALAFSYLRDDPIHYLALAPRKILRHFSVDNEAVIQNDMQAHEAGDEITWWWAIAPTSAFFHEMILAGFLLALAMTAARNALRWQIWFCVLPAAYFAAISAVFFAEQRFNLPSLPFMIGGAVLGYAGIAEMVAARLRAARHLAPSQPPLR